MKIWIDADAAPQMMKQVIFKAAKRRQIETILVANASMPTPGGADWIYSIAVSHGENIADKYIVEHAEPGDLAITADIPLAADLVANGVVVIDPRGDEYNEDNIAPRLSQRNFLDELRGTNALDATHGGNAPYGEKDKRHFAAAFDRTLTRLLPKDT